MTTCTFIFVVQHAHTQFGDEVLVSGECAALGAWDVSRAVPLTTSAATFPVWRSAPIALPLLSGGAPQQFKFVLRRADGRCDWENVWWHNRTLATGAAAATVVVADCGHFDRHTPAVLLSAASGSAPPLAVMTFNVRYDTSDDGAHAWPHRRAALARFLRAPAPLVIGLQEVLPHQADFLAAELSARYDAYAVPREWRGEACMILFDRERFAAVERDTIWLCEGSDDGQRVRGWDAACVRVCSFVRLYDKLLHRTMLVFNCHLDHRGARAKIESQRLIRRRMAHAQRNPFEPMILLGDFNMVPNETGTLECISALRYARTCANCKLVGDVDNTFTGFGLIRGGVIDYIFTDSNGNCLEYEVTETPELSDHNAVTAKLEWTK
jgi:endonuclease/exonuclease/phosphatase family metal-dependent hydrolase